MPSHEVWEFPVTIPAGTLITAPVTIATAFPVRRVREIHWRVPRGALGLMGWRITMSKAQVIPRQQGGWLIHDGQSGRWALDNLPDSGAWEVTGYNTGLHPHTVYITYLTEVIMPEPPLPSLWEAMQLAESPDLSTAGPPVGSQ